MALNTSKYNHLTPLPFKGLSCHYNYESEMLENVAINDIDAMTLFRSARSEGR